MSERSVCVLCCLAYTGMILFISGSSGIAFSEARYEVATVGWLLSGAMVFLAIKRAALSKEPSRHEQ